MLWNIMYIIIVRQMSLLLFLWQTAQAVKDIVYRLQDDTPNCIMLTLSAYRFTLG